MKIRVDRELCVGAGMCALSAPGVFAQAKDDGRVIVLDAQPATIPAQHAARKASYLCPSGAITIESE
jgi:ferredoxin